MTGQQPSRFANIVGKVTYTPGDGAPIQIPKGRVEVDLADDSATLSWEQAPEVVGSTAMPRLQFDDYLRDGDIAWSDG